MKQGTEGNPGFKLLRLERENVPAHLFNDPQVQRRRRQGGQVTPRLSESHSTSTHRPSAAEWAAQSKVVSMIRTKNDNECTFSVPRSRREADVMLEKVWRPRRDLNRCYRRERTIPLSKCNDLQEAGGPVSHWESLQATSL